MAGLELKIIEPQENEEDATEKQKAFIRALCSEVGGSIPAASLNELGKRQASSIIEQLQSFKAELAGDKPLDTSRLSGIDWDGIGKLMSPDRRNLRPDFKRLPCSIL